MTSISALNILGAAAAGNSAPAASTAPLTVLGFASQNASASAKGSGGVAAVFGALSDATSLQAIQNILTGSQTKSTQTAVYENIANYLQALQSGQLQPSNTWQTNAAYLQQTGQPFVVTLDASGQPQITLEAQADLSRYSPAQQDQLATALQQVATMAQKIQANTTNQNWLNTLTNVEPALQAFQARELTPAQGWQSQAADLQADGIPFKIVLNAQGNVTIENQFSGDFADANTTNQPILLAAAAQLQTALQTGVTPLAWEAQAYEDVQKGQDYYLDVDPTTGGIVIKNNTAANIVPAFLQTPPYSDIGADTPMLQQAANFIQQGAGFYLDIGSNAQVVVRQNDSQGISTYNQPRSQAVQNPIINLLT